MEINLIFYMTECSGKVINMEDESRMEVQDGR